MVLWRDLGVAGLHVLRFDAGGGDGLVNVVYRLAGYVLDHVCKYLSTLCGMVDDSARIKTS